MKQPSDNGDPDELEPAALLAAGDQPASETKSEPLLARRRLEIEAELAEWNRFSSEDQTAALRNEVCARPRLSHEVLVCICRQAVKANDRKRLNLAFEALSKSATPLLLSQVRGFPKEDRRDAVQEILTLLFKAILAKNTDYAEVCFASFSRRRAIELYRAHKRHFESVAQRIEPAADTDPIDDLPGFAPNAEWWALFSTKLNKLPDIQRAYFILHYRQALTLKEIAAHYQVDASTVGKQLKKAVATLGLSGAHNDH
jgi:RNA polymerase sigma factor (sigma-70 family)